MIRSRLLFPLAFAVSAVISAQTPALVPAPAPAPEPPQAPAAPRPAVAPRALIEQELDKQLMQLDKQLMQQDVAQQKLKELQWEKLAPQERAFEKQFEYNFDKLPPSEWLPKPGLAPLARPLDFNFKYDFSDGPMFLAQQMVKARTGREMNDDRLYEAGQNALDNHRYDTALENFNQVAARAGSRADAGWYWKAYTLNKLGRRDEAIAALAELRKTYSGSRWLDDAKALELEVKQQAGRPVSPESESDEDLKLMALNGLMQSDAERAVPLIENLLKGSQSPRLKDRALYVLAVSNSPRAQQSLEKVARGGGNPDLQLKAIRYLSSMRRRQQGGNTATTPSILPEIYASSNDANVKRAILQAYMSNRDNQHLAEVAKSEKNADLRWEAFRALGNNTGQPELWPIYQTETSVDAKEQILSCMNNNGNVEKLAEVARTEKDPKLRKAALRALSSHRDANIGDMLVSIYNTEQDAQNKRSIVDNLASQRNAKALVDIARSEKDTKMKIHIVDMLSNMKSKEASDYLMEILSK